MECLRDRTLKYFYTKSKVIQQDYQALCKKLDERFGCKDLPHIVRRQLQDFRQNPDETLEEYAKRAQELSTDGYPESPDTFIQILATDAFLKGCMDKKAALTAMDKDPDNLDLALQYVKSALTNQRVIMGPKKMDTSVKTVTFENTEVDEIEEMEQPTASVRAVFRKSENSTSGIDISRFEARLEKTEDDVQETKSAVREILDILTGKNQARSRPPQRQTSPRQNPNRGFN